MTAFRRTLKTAADLADAGLIEPRAPPRSRPSRRATRWR